MLEIKALGNLIILKNGVILDNLGSRKAGAALAYLALEGRPQGRMRLATLFWPESPDQKALASLRVMLASLRKNVDDYIEITRDTVGIKQGVDVTTDVQLFEKQIARGNLTQALKLYRGNLLEVLHFSDCNEFENWRRWEQERLNLLLIEALQTDTSNQLALGNYKEGEKLASELLRIDPFNETALRQVMIALTLVGKRTDAMKQYKRSSAFLMDELGILPSAETVHIKQLAAQGATELLAQQVTPKNNLPYLKTSFIGREQETEQCINLLHNENCRLLTIAGPGGAGKTSLALNLAKKVLGSFVDGVYFIPLDKVQCPDYLIHAIAESLEFSFDQITLQQGARKQLINYLSGRSILLILDGYEHLIDSSEFLSELLQQTVDVKLLVTSRQKLNIQGEWVQSISGLPIPDHLESAGRNGSSSLDLFVERAKQTLPGLTLSEEELNAALQICRLVEGFPLAVELAASWTTLLSCTEIAKEIQHSFNFLSSQMLDVPEKHRSLKAAFNYSWQMLKIDQQRVLEKLSVFRGGFTHQAAQQIAGADWMILTELLNRSLVYRASDGRIFIHKVILGFIEEKLFKKPELFDEIAEKHSRHYLNLLYDKENDFSTGKMITAREVLRPEIENLRKAVCWAAVNQPSEAALKAVSSYFSFYMVHGWYDGEIAFDQLADFVSQHEKSPPLDNPVYLSCRAHQGWFCANLSMVEVCDRISKEILQPLQQKDMKKELALCLHNLGVSTEFRGDYETSRDLLERAVEIGMEIPFVAFPSYYLWLGYVHFLLGEYQEGMRSFETSYSLFIKDGNIWASSFALSKMGLAADGVGEHASAMNHFREAYEIFLNTGDITGQAYSLSRMSIGAYFLDEYASAYEYGEQALNHFKDIGHLWGICASSGHLGFIHLGTGKSQEAQTIFYDTLELASDADLDPLSLYALAGLSCTFVTEGKKKEASDLFSYVRSHPRTPALYIDVAKHWLQDQSKSIMREKKTGGTHLPLTEVIAEVLVKS
jgi:DNA-binding SARP family transcriptional activator